MPTLSPATAGTGTASAAVGEQYPLLCSDSLPSSDDLDCSDTGAVAAVSSTGTMVPA